MPDRSMPQALLRQAAACALLLCALASSSAAQVIVRGSLAQEATATPGGTYENTIVLYNEGDTSRTAEVSLRDYTFSADGSTRYSDPGTLARSNAPWIDYGGSTVTLPPEQEVEVTYQVDVPAQVEGGPPLGTYWSIILVEPLNQPRVTDDQGLAVQQVRRYGIQVATHIQDTGSPDLEVMTTDLVSGEDQTQLRLALENTGTRGDQPSVRLEMYDEGGELAAERTSPAKLIYPGTSVAHRLELTGLSSGKYQALIVIESETGRPTGIQLSVEL